MLELLKFLKTLFFQITIINSTSESNNIIIF